MRKVLISTVVAIMAMNSGIHAQEKYQGMQEIKLEMIYQLDTMKLHRGDRLLSEIEETLRMKAEIIPEEDVDWVLNKIRLDIIRQTKRLYTDSGSEIEIPYCAYLPYSSNYRYFILNTCDYEERIARNQRAKLIRTSDGRVMWDIEGKMMAYAAISNDGSVTVEQLKPSRSEGVICRTFNLYNSEGNLVNSLNGLVSLPMRYALSDHGNMLVIVVTEEKGDYCIGFDKSGSELWKTQVPSGSYDDETISFLNSDRYFLYSTYSNGAHSLIVDDNGSIRGHYDFIIRQGTYTDDGRYLIFDVKNDSVRYLDLQNAQVIHERIVDGLTADGVHYFVNLTDQLGIDGIAVFDKEGRPQGIYIKKGFVSPQRHVILTTRRIYILEAGHEE